MELPQKPSLDTVSGVPLYSQVKEWLLGGIRDGWWAVGTPIPSERILSDELEVSRATLRQAVDEMEREGWLERHQGRGTFVSRPKLEQPMDQLRGFSENMRLIGVEPTSVTLDARLEPADSRVAAALGLRLNEATAVITRLRLADGLPLMLERCRLAYDRTVGVLDEDLSGSLYDLLQQKYGIRLSLGWETLEVRHADRKVLDALGLPANSEVLFTERLTRDEQGVPVEFTYRYARPDRCRFRIELSAGRADFTLRPPGAGARLPNDCGEAEATAPGAAKGPAT